MFLSVFIGVHRWFKKRFCPFHLSHSVANQADLQFHQKDFLATDEHRLKADKERAEKISILIFIMGALNSQVQHSSERMDAWETTTHI